MSTPDKDASLDSKLHLLRRIMENGIEGALKQKNTEFVDVMQHLLNEHQRAFPHVFKRRMKSRKFIFEYLHNYSFVLIITKREFLTELVDNFEPDNHCTIVNRHFRFACGHESKIIQIKPGSNCRGLVWKTKRPDLILIDGKFPEESEFNDWFENQFSATAGIADIQQLKDIYLKDFI